MHVVVTGGLGFIGTNLGRELVKHGHRVTTLDWRNPANGIVRRVDDLSRSGVFRDRMDGIIGHDSVDCVVQLAARVGRLNGEHDLAYTIRSNVIMTTLVAQYCGAYGIRLAYTSTSEVYGDNGDATCHEDTGPFTLPRNLYGLSKKWGEEACQLYAPDGLVIFRPSMPYGPGVPPGRGRRALDNFLWQANTGQNIPVHTGAERSWCWIGDVVAGMRLVLEETASAGAWNVGRDDDPRSLWECALKACELADVPTDRIEMVTPPSGQTTVKRLSTEKLRALGWRPTVEFDEGMRALFDWIRNFDKYGDYTGVAENLPS